MTGAAKSVDCRSPEGITIGAVDAIITLARLLRDRPIRSEQEREALQDLREDEDVRYLMASA